jgi:hypothetical protein
VPKSSQVIFEIKDPRDDKWQQGVEGTIYARTALAFWGRITIIRTYDQAPGTSLDVVIDIIQET